MGHRQGAEKEEGDSGEKLNSGVRGCDRTSAGSGSQGEGGRSMVWRDPRSLLREGSLTRHLVNLYQVRNPQVRSPGSTQLCPVLRSILFPSHHVVQVCLRWRKSGGIHKQAQTPSLHEDSEGALIIISLRR